ncbi:MAG: translation elongation factor Ts, partial [Acidobacteriota bacterium]
ISASQVKKLRERTGAGMMRCKSALVESAGDLDKAIIVLRKRGLAASAKKAGRTTAEGIVASYIHAGGKIGVMVEVNCETDFVAKTEAFQSLVRDVAMHIAAASPQVISRDQVDPDAVKAESQIVREQALASGKPEKVVERIVEGRMDRFFQDICLLEQSFVKDPDKNVQSLLHEAIGKLGENICIRRFVRFGLGEPLAGEEDGHEPSSPPAAR